MKIAIPDAPHLSPLTANAQAVCEDMGWELLVVPEDRAATMLINHMVDMALVSPLGYGSGVGKVDLRIIPGPCMVLNDYTNIAGIRFRDNIEEIRTIGSHQPASFLPVIGSLLMREKFEAPSTPVQRITKGAPADCMIDLNTPEDEPAAMDVSEEWFDLAEMPLPIAIWACRVEAELDKVTDAARRMAASPLQEVHVTEPITSADVEQFPREGTITWTWSTSVEEAFGGALNLLFFHQVLPEIPEVKVLGREES